MNGYISGYALLGWIVLIFIIATAIGAVWLTVVLLRESHALNKSVKDVQCAFGNIEIEINKKLKVHNALHYSDLLNIVKYVGDMIPGVHITLNREYETNQLHIVVEAGDVRSKLTLMTTIVEYGIPRLSETV